MSSPLPEREYILVNQTDRAGFYVGMRILYVHHPSMCAGQDRPCSVHRPSPHHMRTWSQLWRADLGVMQRLCPHGIGHPDPDEVLKSGSHACDECCNPPLPRLR